MSTGIQWTDETWNIVVGCHQISPGCAHCYAKQAHDKRHAAFKAGKLQNVPQYAWPFEVVQLKPERLHHPIIWKQPRRIFVNSVADLFHDDVPFAFVDRVWAVMSLTPRHTFQILTKRPARMFDYFDKHFTRHKVAALASEFSGRRDGALGTCDHDVCNAPFPLPNVWLGVSVENQRFADERIPLLLRTPAAVRFLSCEPLLGPVNLRRIGVGARGDDHDALLGWRTRYGYKARTPDECSISVTSEGCARIDWVILGGESGAQARPFDIRWAAKIVADCKAAGVPAFVKQMGDMPMEPHADWSARGTTRLLNARNHSRVPADYVPLKFNGAHGDQIDEWPAELRVREWPR